MGGPTFGTVKDRPMVEVGKLPSTSREDGIEIASDGALRVEDKPVSKLPTNEDPIGFGEGRL